MRGPKMKSIFETIDSETGVPGVYLDKMSNGFVAAFPKVIKGQRKMKCQTFEESLRVRNSAYKVYRSMEPQSAKVILSNISKSELLKMTKPSEVQSVIDKYMSRNQRKSTTLKAQNKPASNHVLLIPRGFEALGKKVIEYKNRNTELSYIFKFIADRYDRNSPLNKMYYESMRNNGKSRREMDKLIVKIFYSNQIEFEEPKFRLKFSDNQYLKTKGGNFEIVNKEKAQQFSENQLIILNKTFSIDKFIKEEV